MNSVLMPWWKAKGLQEDPEPHSSADSIAGVSDQSLVLGGEARAVAPTC